VNFVKTRARNTDSDTSHEAAKAAVSKKCDVERLEVRLCVLTSKNGRTAKEVAKLTGIDYIEVQRRISECGLTKTKDRRDGCAVWTL
jgi:hypothetical protein